jgi:tRNA nucleotidyltransferase (CCA-adding enzyme)
MKHNIPLEVIRIIETLEEASFEAYIVGGSIRDILLGVKPKDWDVATNASPEEIISLFKRTFYENEFGTVGVVTYETDEEAINIDKSLHVIEITSYRAESDYSDGRRPDNVMFKATLEEDLSRRDFTINAVAYNPTKNATVDLFGGLDDLKNRVVKTVGSPDARFKEDYLRMLRAVRIATQLDFNLSHETLESIIKNSSLLSNVSRERVRDELIKLFMCNTPMIGFITLEYSGLLSDIIPELRLGIGMKQTVNHSYDVWGHLLRSMQCAADKDYDLDLRIAALLHDIAKPHTAKRKNDSENTFYGHEVVGAKVSREILLRLKFPKHQVDKITKLIRWHMFFSDPDQITLSAARRMITNVGRENIWELMNLRICDRIGTGRPKEDPYRLRKYHAMIEQCLLDPIDLKMLKIDGEKIIKVTHETPGPKIGLILNALMGEVFDDPSLNDIEILSKRAKELVNLDIKELSQLAEKGKNDLKDKDEQLLDKINKKHNVK